MKMCFQVTHSEFFKSLLMSRHVVPRSRRSQCGSRECRQPAPPPRGWLEMTGGKQIGQGKWLWLKLGLNSLRYIYIYYHTLYYINIIYYIYINQLYDVLLCYITLLIFFKHLSVLHSTTTFSVIDQISGGVWNCLAKLLGGIWSSATATVDLNTLHRAERNTTWERRQHDPKIPKKQSGRCSWMEIQIRKDIKPRPDQHILGTEQM